MANDDNALDKLVVDARKSAAELGQVASGLENLNQRVGAAEEKLASTVERTSARKIAARKASELSGTASVKKEADAAGLLADVVAKTSDKTVIAVQAQERILRRVERAYAPISVAARKAAKDVEDLLRVIDSASNNPDMADNVGLAKSLLPLAQNKLADLRAAEAESVPKPDSRLSSEAQKVRDQINPNLPVIRAYAAEVDKLSGLLEKNALGEREVAQALAIATTEYQKQLSVTSGAAAAAQKEKELANAAQMYLDKIDKTLPLQRTYREELAKINELIASRNLTPAQGLEAAAQAKKTFDTKSADVTGTTAANNAYEKELQSLKNILDPLAVAQRNYAQAVDFANHALRSGDIDARQHNAAVALARTNLDKAEEANKKYGAAATAASVGVRQMQFAVTNLGFQVNDVVSGVLSGQQPFRIFAQQAGQFVQVFEQGGGVRNVIGGFVAQLAGLVTPARAAAAGLAAVGVGVGALLLRSSSNAEQLRQFNLILRQTGKDALTTADDLQKTVRQLQAAGVSRDDARSITTDITRNPRLNPGQAPRIAQTGLDVGARLGIGDAEGVKAFTGAIEGGADALIKLGFSMDALSVPEATAIRDLQRHGQNIEALNKAIDILSKNIAGSHKDSLTASKTAINELTSAWGEFLDKLSNSGAINNIRKLLTENLKDWADIAAGNFRSAFERNGLVSPQSAMTGGADWRAQANAAVRAANPRAGDYPGSATGTGNISGLNPALADPLQRMIADAAEKGIILGIGSGFRSTERQAQLYAQDIASHGGSPSGMVAPPGRSNHERGEAADLVDASGRTIRPFSAADLYLRANAEQFGLRRPMSYEPWHVERIQGRVESGIPPQSTTSASAADAARSSALVPDKAKLEEGQKALDDLKKGYADVTRDARFFGVQQQANTAYTSEYNRSIAAGLEDWQAQKNAQIEMNKALALGSIELHKTISVEDQRIAGLGKEAAALKVSEAAGYRAAAQVQAEIEVRQHGIGSVAQRTDQILREGAASAIRASAQQSAAAQPQLVALGKLADATLRGTKAAHEQDLQNQAVLQTQDALAKAEAARDPILIAEAKAATDAAFANIKLADSRRQSIAAAEAANENKLTLEQTNLQRSLTQQGLTDAEIQRRLDYLTVSQNLATKFAGASEEAAKGYANTAIAIADAKVGLADAQREQQRWNDLVRDLANTIENELTRSIENAFSEDKVESWGKRIQRWLGTATSQLSSSLFIRPALGTLAGALGFGSVAQSLGSFGGAGSLFGGGAAGGTSATITPNGDGTFSLSNLSSAASLGKSLFGGSESSGGLFSGVSDFFSGGLGGIFAHTPTAADFAAGVGPVINAPGSIFGSTTLGSFAGGVGTGFGAGALLNSLLGGNKVTGTAGSGVGSLLGTGLGSLFGFPMLGGIAGGLFGSLAGLFGNNKPSNNATGFSFDLASGTASNFQSSGNAQNDQTAKQIQSSLGDFTKTITRLSGGTLGGYINPQAGTRDGIVLNYNIPGFGSGSYKASDAQDAIEKAQLAIARGLTGISTTMKTVIDQITDPSKLQDAIAFADTYDKIATAAKDAFSSIPSDLNVAGQFEQARDSIKATFDAISDKAREFGLAVEPVNAALDEANKRLRQDFNRHIADLTTAIDNPLQSMVEAAQRAGSQLVREAQATGGSVVAVNRYNAKVLDGIWRDQTSSLKDLADELRTGDLSGLTTAQRLKAANDNYSTILADVRAGKTSEFNDLVSSARNVFSLSTAAYGQGPKTVGLRTDILSAIDGVLASRSFAGGTAATPPGMILVGEKGPELISQPGGMQVFTHSETEKILSAMPQTNIINFPKERSFADGTSHIRDGMLFLPSPATVLPHGQTPSGRAESDEMAALLRDLLAEMRANTGTTRQGLYETIRALQAQLAEMQRPTPYEPTRRKVAA